MVLRKSGRVDSRRFRVRDSKQGKGVNSYELTPFCV
jgi:hypothetical protein